jgi:hypothetical protein
MGFITETMMSSRRPEDHDFHRYNRLSAEKKLARLERRRATRQTLKEVGALGTAQKKKVAVTCRDEPTLAALSAPPPSSSLLPPPPSPPPPPLHMLSVNPSCA